MKKGLVILGALVLSACTVGHETDLDAAAQKRALNIETRHQATGCTFVRDHDEYRNCLLNTYNLQKPATYHTSTLQDGRPVAIVNPTVQGVAPCGLPAIQTQQRYEWAAPTTASQTTTVETLCQKKFEPQQTVIQTTEEVMPAPIPEEPQTEVIFVQQEPTDAMEITEQTVVVPEPEPVVWAQAPMAAEPVCPCPDPNDPCPQCYDK